MKKIETKEVFLGVRLLPSFPLVLVTVERNIMTAAAFHFYSFKPPSVMVGIMPERFTYELISQVGEFGINIPTTEQLDLARMCGSISGRNNVDKYAWAGVTPRQGVVIHSPLIEECPLNLECVVVHRIDHPGTHCWFVGEIKAVHLAEDYTKDCALMYWSREYRRVGEIVYNR